MVDEEIDEEYEYPEDVVEINQHRFVGVRTLILALIALFGYMPNGVKKACIEPPSPLLNPLALAKISARAP